MTRLRSIAAAIVMVVASFGIFMSPAAAHESRTVGPYTFVVGWIAEPAIAGQSNGLDLTVTTTKDGAPVDGLAKTLKAEVITGGGAKIRVLDLAADSDQPGHYTSRFVATRDADGTYAMVYAPIGRAFSVKMDTIKGPKVTASWFNPRTGAAAKFGEFANAGPREFLPPDPGELLDWVLVLDDAAKNYPPPGQVTAR